jgi:hypothetical protein
MAHLRLFQYKPTIIYHFYSIVSIFIILTFTLLACKEESSLDFPVVMTGDVTQVTDTSALLTAKIIGKGNYEITESGFIWGLHKGNSNDLKLINHQEIPGIFSRWTDIKLLKGKMYYVRAYVKTNTAFVLGREVAFKIPESTPFGPGVWTQVINTTTDGSSVTVNSAFTIGNSTYFIVSENIYKYDHLQKKFTFVLTNSDIAFTSLSTVYNNRGYIFSQNVFYCFDPADNSMVKLKKAPDFERYSCTGFRCDGDIYVGLGFTSDFDSANDFLKYNITSDSWSKVASFPGTPRLQAFSFSIGGKGYVGGGDPLMIEDIQYLDDFNMYDPVSDTWFSREKLPLVPGYPLPCGVSSGRYGYIFDHNTLYEYDNQFNFWEVKAHLYSSTPLDPCLFDYNNKLFSCGICQDTWAMSIRLWKYDR